MCDFQDSRSMFRNPRRLPKTSRWSDGDVLLGDRGAQRAKGQSSPTEGQSRCLAASAYGGLAGRQRGSTILGTDGYVSSIEGQEEKDIPLLLASRVKAIEKSIFLW